MHMSIVQRGSVHHVRDAPRRWQSMGHGPVLTVRLQVPRGSHVHGSVPGASTPTLDCSVHSGRHHHEWLNAQRAAGRAYETLTTTAGLNDVEGCDAIDADLETFLRGADW